MEPGEYSGEHTESLKQLGYRLTEHLHSDSHFDVYRGVRIDDATAVVIKATSPNAGRQANARLKREYDLTRSLDDDGIICAQALEGTAQVHVLIFPDKLGISLSRYLDGRSLTFDSFFEIAIQLAEILGRIHARDVVHKDIKPANILLFRRVGEPGAVRLGDFGLARTADRSGDTRECRLRVA